MKKSPSKPEAEADRDTMRPEYDFSGGKPGVTAARFREGSNVVVIDPEVLDVFPDSRSVNEALRTLADMIRRNRERRSA